MMRLTKMIPALFPPFTFTFKWHDQKLEEMEKENKELKKKLEEAYSLNKTEIVGKNNDEQDQLNDKLHKDLVGLKNSIEKLRDEMEKKTQQWWGKKVEQQKDAAAGRWSRVHRSATIGNKWNARDCGPNLAFREYGLTVIYSGETNNWNTVRGQSAVPRVNLNRKSECITGYYEVEIGKRKHAYGGLRIGFCDKQYPLESDELRIGNAKHSIGINCDEAVKVNGLETTLCQNKPAGKFFNEGNVIGCGLLYSPEDPSFKCFVTFNGKLIGMVDLPIFMLDIVLYPALSLTYSGDSIKTNFGQDQWRFDPTQILKE